MIHGRKRVYRFAAVSILILLTLPAASFSAARRRLLVNNAGAAGVLHCHIRSAEGRHLVAIAQCLTAHCARSAYAHISRPDLAARIVLNTTLLRINGRDRRAACELLRNIPTTGDQYDELSRLQGFLYQGETTEEIRAVGDGYWHLSENLGKALELCPGHLAAFIAYGRIAARNHQDPYPDVAATVCKKSPAHFLDAYKSLPKEERQYIRQYVIRPQTCRQLAIPAE